MTSKTRLASASASAIIHKDAEGAITRIDIFRDGIRQPSIKPTDGDWQMQVVSLAGEFVARQVSTWAGAARSVNRMGEGALRAAAPNGRYWTADDVALA
jgi:hypothetical protein